MIFFALIFNTMQNLCVFKELFTMVFRSKKLVAFYMIYCAR